jgi:hypothetical protein
MAASSATRSVFMGERGRAAREKGKRRGGLRGVARVSKESPRWPGRQQEVASVMVLRRARSCSLSQ